MAPRRLPLLLALSTLALAACRPSPAPPPGAPAATAAPADAGAAAFLARVDAEYRRTWPETTAAQWLSTTDAGPDAQRLAELADARARARLDAWLAEAGRHDNASLPAAQRRQLDLLWRLDTAPAPPLPAQRDQMGRLAGRLEGGYAAAAACQAATAACRPLPVLERVLADNRDYDAQLQAWRAWHDAAAPLHAPFRAFVALANAGARHRGQPDLGALWRSGYDMPPAQLEAEVERLWKQVAPLYGQLQCYAGRRLQEAYGRRGTLPGGLLPAHLLGDMWQQDWSNAWDLLQPYPQAASPDVTDALQRRRQGRLRAALAQVPAGDADARFLAGRDAARAGAQDMARQAEAFYVSLGLPALPQSFWQRSQFVRPLERQALCEASAWDMDLAGDVRVRMCLAPNESDFLALVHEMGHLYYDLAYHAQPVLLQGGANDAFHEAVGDTAVLAMTPAWLHAAGLAGAPGEDRRATINAQMRIALSRLPRLPFALAMERWRWGVFDGTIAPAQDNRAWWALKARYQGVAPAAPRADDAFDPGAKYHVAANIPYLRYFLADVLQFQLHAALCRAAGQDGALQACSIAGNAEAGRRLQAMMARGASQPWQRTLQELTGQNDFDAAPMLEYFAPLSQWLAEQNRGRDCAWTPDTGTAAPAP